MSCDKFCEKNHPLSAWDTDREIQESEPFTQPHCCTRKQSSRTALDFYYEHRSIELHRPSKHHDLVVMTACRPLGSTLEKTLQSLKSAGAERWQGNTIVSSDGLCPPFNRDSIWKSYEQTPAKGSALAFIQAIKRVLSMNPDLDYLTIVEDDVELCKNALDYIAQVVVFSDVSFLSWFTYPYDFSGLERRPNYRVSPARESIPLATLACRPSRFFVLNQVCTYPRRTLDRLLACPHITDDWPQRNGHDEMPSWALGDELYATHLPILAQHTGGLNSAVTLSREALANTSSDPQDGERTSPLYVGADFDALSLLDQKDA
jgi:hypothetical protein